MENYNMTPSYDLSGETSLAAAHAKMAKGICAIQGCEGKRETDRWFCKDHCSWINDILEGAGLGRVS